MGKTGTTNIAAAAAARHAGPGSRALARAVVAVLEHRAGLALERGSPAVEHLSPQLVLWAARDLARLHGLRVAGVA